MINYILLQVEYCLLEKMLCKIRLWYEYNKMKTEHWMSLLKKVFVMIEFKDNYRYFHLFHNHNKLENNKFRNKYYKKIFL